MPDTPSQEMPQAEKVRKPGWQLLREAALAITCISPEAPGAADMDALRKELWRQVRARLEEIIPEAHERNVVIEVLKAEIRIAVAPQLSPWGTQFVLDRLDVEDVKTVLLELGDAWRMVEYIAPCPCGDPECPVKKAEGEEVRVRIAERSLAEAVSRSIEVATQEGDVYPAIGNIIAAILTGPFGGRLMSRACDSAMADETGGFVGAVGDPIIVVGPDENPFNVISWMYPGAGTIGIGGPHAAFLIELLLNGRRRGDQPGEPEAAASEGTRTCRLCGCTEDCACPQGCAWDADDPTVCTACAATTEDVPGVDPEEARPEPPDPLAEPEPPHVGGTPPCRQ